MELMKPFFLLLLATSLSAQQAYRTEVFRDDIKSLEIRQTGILLSSPVLTLGSSQGLEIVFDALHHTEGRFAYKIIHLDADWKPSSLIPIEYMKGFNEQSIDDFKPSFNTTTLYTNYRLALPNDNMQFIASGNYAAVIYEESAPDEPVLTACFSVVEPLTEITATVSGNTDIDFNKTHQQVEFTVHANNLNITHPQSDLKIYVWQNNNLSDARSGLTPTSIRSNQFIYSHNRNLIFDARNEYRRFEFQTHQYDGMGVESTKFFSPYYHITLFGDRRRTNYVYDQDQNGRFFINCRNCQTPDNEADYFIVHFSFASERFSNGEVYLFGDFFNNIADARSRMEYDTSRGVYEKAVMLKQGLYNYLYAYKAQGSTRLTLDETEGDFFETENEYTIAVYFRPFGARYDRLVGYVICRTKT